MILRMQTLAADGIGGLYKGFGPAIARSFPANATCFLVYEIVSTAMKQVAGAPEEALHPVALAQEGGR